MEVDLGKPYKSLADAEYHAIFANGNMAVRFGPFTAPEMGKIMIESLKRKVSMSMTIVCKGEVDWELVEDLCRKESA